MVGSSESILKIAHWLEEKKFQPYAEGNLYIIGATKVGKSTVSCELDKSGFGIQKSASGWIKGEFSQDDYVDYSSLVSAVTEESKIRLKKNPNACVDWIKKGFNCAGGGLIIEGIRNPSDFVKLFDMNKDLVIFVSRSDIQPCNSFESGIEVIKSYIKWLEKNFDVISSLEVEL